VCVDVFSSQLLKHAQFNIATVGLGDSGTNTIQGGLREPSEKGVGMCMYIIYIFIIDLCYAMRRRQCLEAGHTETVTRMSSCPLSSGMGDLHRT
jgi:hypothetical protein